MDRRAITEQAQHGISSNWNTTSSHAPSKRAESQECRATLTPAPTILPQIKNHCTCLLICPPTGHRLNTGRRLLTLGLQDGQTYYRKHTQRNTFVIRGDDCYELSQQVGHGTAPVMPHTFRRLPAARCDPGPKWHSFEHWNGDVRHVVKRNCRSPGIVQGLRQSLWCEAGRQFICPTQSRPLL